MTKLYLRDSSNGTSGLPTTEQSTKTSSFDWIVQTANKNMNTTIGTSQVTVTKLLSNNKTMVYLGRWVSASLVATTINSNTWTLNFAAMEADTSSDFPVAGSNQPLWINCYVWRPSNSTKIGTVLDGNSASNFTEPSAASTIKVLHGTFSGAQVTSVQSSDVLILEIWCDMTAQPNQNWNNAIYYDGTTENTTANATVSNHASFLDTPQDIFSAGGGSPVTTTVTGKQIGKSSMLVKA